jgi:iron complex outermembrane receptor protein
MVSSGLNRFSLALAVAAFLPAVAFSQTETSEDEPPSNSVLEEVMVTARKVQESLQDVPIAVTVLDGQELMDSQIYDVSQIAGRVPSFTWQQHNTIHSEISLRGIGTVRSFGAAGDSSVGYFLDEVYIGCRGAAMPPLFDLERLEALRGPQGTLFGKNVVGGAISVVTAKPQDEFSASAYAGFGNYSSIQSGGYITGAVSEDVSMRLAFYQNKHDGYAQNIVYGEEMEDLEALAARLSLTWNINENMKLDLTLDGSTEEGNGQSRHSVDDPNVPGPGFVTPNLRSQDPRTNESPYDQWGEKDTFGFTARFEWYLDGFDLVYLGAVREGDSSVRWTQTGTTSPPTATDSTLTQPEDYRGITQELRFASKQDQKFRWLVGLYYLDDDTKASTRNTAVSFLNDGPGSLGDILDGDYIIQQRAVSKNYAIFGDLAYDFSEDVTLSVGGRYTKDKKDWDSEAIVLGLGPPGSLYPTAPLTQGPYHAIEDDSWSEFTPKAILDWKFGENYLLYGSIAKGFKGGGWQGGAGTLVAASTPYDPETAWSYELGLKTELMDNRIRLNLAAFYTDFQDLQVELLDDVNLVLVVANAADAVIKGIEVEFEAALHETVTLFASGSYVDAEYKDYIDPLRGFDYSGNQIQRAPKEQFNIGFDLRAPLTGGLVLLGNVSYSYQSKMYFGPDESNFEPGYGTVDARVGFGAADGKWSVVIWGRNLTDELYRTSIIPFFGDEHSVFAAPRTYGVKGTINF